jgi:aryl-alcohol dehydrogenase-like predicted oxidoreductase
METAMQADTLMPREEALFKLIALEPILRVEMEIATGWPIEETRAVLARLREAGLVKYILRQNQPWFCAGAPRRAEKVAAC